MLIRVSTAGLRDMGQPHSIIPACGFPLMPLWLQGPLHGQNYLLVTRLLGNCNIHPIPFCVRHVADSHLLLPPDSAEYVQPPSWPLYCLSFPIFVGQRKQLDKFRPRLPYWFSSLKMAMKLNTCSVWLYNKNTKQGGLSPAIHMGGTTLNQNLRDFFPLCGMIQ